VRHPRQALFAAGLSTPRTLAVGIMTSDWCYSGFVPALNGPESPQGIEIRVDHSHGYGGGDSSRLDVQGAPPMSRRVPEDQTVRCNHICAHQSLFYIVVRFVGGSHEARYQVED
jgi:hypothetical protein